MVVDRVVEGRVEVAEPGVAVLDSELANGVIASACREGFGSLALCDSAGLAAAGACVVRGLLAWVLV